MPVDERFKKGIALFNEEEFFECHEVIEDLWLATQDEHKDLYKGVIQAAVALHHLKNGNVSGARKLFKTSSRYLGKYTPEALGLNVEKLLTDMQACFKSIDEGLIPKLEFQMKPKLTE
ncbi:MAG: hypothetical protein A3C35_03810 [Omnitrophica bacterium RIFCSPHIGHO2_02_FULL_46_11]|nr:MAG: hypothetical protein A3C35_03810 [Omnitrophica bacterium RIFCSPHIGHO2_02_FULL_46_11]OGW87057.1 MAG: hypothetical protein A3A81_00480 [Omnitrophica bacterium RIFCSPLOWO2_01_FULL_45_10b]